jgi:hypothetical protein
LASSWPIKQIHQLPAAAALVPEDQLVVSQTGSNATRRAALAGLPFQPVLPGTTRRTIAGKLAETVSVKDFGAAGTIAQLGDAMNPKNASMH